MKQNKTETLRLGHLGHSFCPQNMGLQPVEKWAQVLCSREEHLGNSQRTWLLWNPLETVQKNAPFCFTMNTLVLNCIQCTFHYDLIIYCNKK